MSIRILAILSCAVLGGCGLVPPAVSIASLAVDAFSYAVSGKSVSDHGLSIVMQEDCAVLRLVQGKGICAPEPHPETEIAAPRDPDQSTLLASTNTASDVIEADREGLRWVPLSAGAFPAQYLVAGPLLGEPPIVPAVLVLEPIAAGPVDVVAIAGVEPGA